MIFGYARVSTQEQELDLQIDALNKHGVDEIFQEKMTGKRKDRPELEQLLKVLRKGDRVVVYKLDRISRSTKHLIELTELFEEKEVEFVSLADNIDTTTAMGRFFFRVMASMAELERDIISERTRAGLESAKARGRHGGRPSVSQKMVERAVKMYDSRQHSVSEICEVTGMSKTTLYRYVEKNRKR